MSLIDEYHAVNTLRILKFSGADTLSFLQGQLSNDINALSSTWHFSGYCNPKGRLLALFQVWRHNDDVYATIDSSLVEAISKRLKMYVMRSKVVIEVLSGATCSGLIDSSIQTDRFALSVDGDTHILEFGGRSLLIDLSGSIKGIDSSNWGLASISAGEPTIDADNAELFVPQMVNLDLLNGINFKKGCYTGQEIVARMHYLGKLKQRMYICKLDSGTQSDESQSIKPGDRVTTENKNAGNIVAVSGGSALAVIRRELLSSELCTESGVRITPLPQQPYSIPG